MGAFNRKHAFARALTAFSAVDASMKSADSIANKIHGVGTVTDPS